MDTPPNDRPSVKMANNSFANMLEVISEAFGLQIECSSFLTTTIFLLGDVSKCMLEAVGPAARLN
jgi:hypothetical protein